MACLRAGKQAQPALCADLAKRIPRRGCRRLAAGDRGDGQSATSPSPLRPGKLGWSSPPKASAVQVGDCIYWFDEEASIYVELAIDANGNIKDSNNAVTLKTGALSFWRSELGAKPSKSGLKKKKPIEPGAIDGKLLSEIVYSAMMMTDIGASACQMPFEEYSARLRYDLRADAGFVR